MCDTSILSAAKSLEFAAVAEESTETLVDRLITTLKGNTEKKYTGF